MADVHINAAGVYVPRETYLEFAPKTGIVPRETFRRFPQTGANSFWANFGRGQFFTENLNKKQEVFHRKADLAVRDSQRLNQP
jgi:hypothetical protein